MGCFDEALVSFHTQLPAKQFRQQRFTQGGEGAGLESVGFYLGHQWCGELIESCGDIGRRDGEPEGVEALGGDSLTSAGASHVLDGVGTQSIRAGK